MPMYTGGQSQGHKIVRGRGREGGVNFRQRQSTAQQVLLFSAKQRYHGKKRPNMIMIECCCPCVSVCAKYNANNIYWNNQNQPSNARTSIDVKVKVLKGLMIITYYFRPVEVSSVLCQCQSGKQAQGALFIILQLLLHIQIHASFMAANINMRIRVRFRYCSC